MSDGRAKMLKGLAQDFQRLREGISALGAKADELERLGDWLQQHCDEVPAIGPGPAAEAMAVIRELKGRVAELEKTLRDVQYKGEEQPAMFDDEPSKWVPTCIGCGAPKGIICESDCLIDAALNKESKDGK